MRFMLMRLLSPGFVTIRETGRKIRFFWPSVILTFFLGALLLTGCSSLIAPKVPALMADRATKNPYSWHQYEDDRSKYEIAFLGVEPRKIDDATYFRNKMLWSVINDVDYCYYQFRTDFFKDRASITTFADMSKLGMSAAATVLGGSAVLSGAVTALEGSQLSVDKNFLEQKATESIFTTMDALRQERMAQIQQKLIMPPPAYTFEEAYSDALSLFNAGSVPSALQRIAAEAGRQQLQAKANNDDATKNRVSAILPEATTVSVSLKSNLNKIISDIISRNDLDTMKKILSKRGVTFEANASGTDLASKVGNELRNARTVAQIAEMVNHFKELKLWKDETP